MKAILITMLLFLLYQMVYTNNNTSIDLIKERFNNFIDNKYTTTLDLSNINMEKITKLGPFVRKVDPLVTAYVLLESLSAENIERIKKVVFSNCNLSQEQILKIFEAIENHLPNLTTLDFSENESIGLAILGSLHKLQHKSTKISNINMKNTFSIESSNDVKEMSLKLFHLFNLEI
jgi:hypothetical protein